MRRLNIVLLGFAQLCGARQPGFSIHDDLVAYPQYEVTFSESFILEHEAQALLDRTKPPHSTYSAEFSTASDISQNVREATGAEIKDGPASEVFERYEVMSMASAGKYLCSIPVLEPQTPENHTATELAKQEEARELAKASAHGWELLNDLDGSCMYFMSGWWSYSFCYNRQVVQFHALSTVPNGQPPIRDPHTAEYVLGRASKSPSRRPDKRDHHNHHHHNHHQQHHHQQQQQQQMAASSGDAPPNTDLQIKGDQRYLVQRLDGGTICDLTGRERTIEVQYHCVPGTKGDRIGWIKEVTTCAYLMVVNTPRLCDDVAFLPPRATTANPISCQLIIPSEDTSAQAKWHRQKTLEAQEAMVGETTDEAAAAAAAATAATDAAKDGQEKAVDQKQQDPSIRDKAQKGVNVGGVIVGARNVLAEADEEGKAPAKLAPPQSYLPGRGHGPLIEIIASAKSKAEGGEMKMLNKEELEKMDLSPEFVEEMRAEVEQIAGDKGWVLEVVEVRPGDPRQIRIIVDEDDEGDGAVGHKERSSEEEEKQQQQQQQEEGSEEQFFKEVV